VRIAVIGLGDIAQKAYLPVLAARRDVELVFCTRNIDVLKKVAEQYRVPETANSLQVLLDIHAKSESRIDAAFVHTATESHVDIVSQCLRAGIPVLVD